MRALFDRVVQVNLQNMHAKSLPPTGARGRMDSELEYQDWARLQGRHTRGPEDRWPVADGRVYGRTMILPRTQP